MNNNIPSKGCIISKRLIAFFGVISSVILFSCKKEIVNQTGSIQRLTVDESKVYYKPNTDSELKLVGNLDKLKEVFKSVYLKKSNVSLVNIAVYSKVYTDESVLVRDLIFPEESQLLKDDKFVEMTKRAKVSLTEFASDFWKIANKSTDPSFHDFLLS